MPDKPNLPLKLKGALTRRSAPHPLGELPDSLAVEIGKRICHPIDKGQMLWLKGHMVEEGIEPVFIADTRPGRNRPQGIHT
jgi:hypothetical protein